MVSSATTTVEQYLTSLPPDRRAEIARVRSVVNAALPRGYEEGMLYGMIGWYIPLARYPETYNGQPLVLAGLASQKQHLALYMMTVYGDLNLEKKFKDGFKAAGKKLDMGKSCVRFKTADALALDVIGETIGEVTPERYIEEYEKIRGANKPAANKPAANKLAANKLAANKLAANKLAANKLAANKPAAKKSAAKRPSPKRPVAKKPIPKKATKKAPKKATKKKR